MVSASVGHNNVKFLFTSLLVSRVDHNFLCPSLAQADGSSHEAGSLYFYNNMNIYGTHHSLPWSQSSGSDIQASYTQLENGRTCVHAGSWKLNRAPWIGHPHARTHAHKQACACAHTHTRAKKNIYVWFYSNVLPKMSLLMFLHHPH